MRRGPGMTTFFPVTWKPPLLDVVIAAVFVAMTVAEAVFSPKVNSPTEHVVIAGMAMVALAWRRRAPLVVAALVVASNLVVNSSGDFTTLLSLVLVSFTVGAETRPPLSYVGLGLVFVPFMIVSIIEDFEPSDLAAGLVFFVGPWAVGVILSDRIASADEAVARARQLERNRELEAARAAAEERTRIARELHDIVSHSISVVTIQTQAVRRRLGPENAAEAADLATVEATAREALAEMRRLFGVLRTEGDQPLALSPQPGLSELDRLVRQVGSGGLEVGLRIEGDPVPLSPGVDLAAYRIAQEGLTNALRHAHATRADVLVRYSPGHLDIEVEDNGRGLTRTEGTHHRSANGGGQGLVGIRERVALYGGTVELVPSSSGGLRLAVRAAPEGGRDMSIRVVIVDDQGMVRAGFRSLLAGEPGLEVVGEADNGEEAVEVVSRLLPDVTLMDIRMPVLDGIAATRQLVAAEVPTKVLVLTTFDLDEYVFEALRAGASGFLLKDAPAEELSAAIRVVASGESLLAPGVTRRVIDAFVRRPAPSPRPRRIPAGAAHPA